MILDSLLPSEIARLVYGYLVKEQCIESAKSFLRESPKLLECRNVLSKGRMFSTRVCGYDLKDILDEHCFVCSLVKENVKLLDNNSKLTHCRGLIPLIKLIFEGYRCQICQKLTPDTSEFSQKVSTVSSTSCTEFQQGNNSSNKDVDKNTIQKSDVSLRAENQLNSHLVQNNTRLEATSLKALSEHIDCSGSRKCEEDETNLIKNILSQQENTSANFILSSESSRKNNELQKKRNQNQDLPKLRLDIINKDSSNTDFEENSTRRTEPEVLTSLESYKSCTLQKTQEKIKKCKRTAVESFEIISCNGFFRNVNTKEFDKHEDSQMIISETESHKNIAIDNVEKQTSDVESSDPENLPLSEPLSIIGDLTFELVNRVEIQETIASNINNEIDSLKINFEKIHDGAKDETNKSITLELSEAVEKAVNKTENDPSFLELLNSVIPPNQEIISSKNQVDVKSAKVQECTKEHEQIFLDSEGNQLDNATNENVIKLGLNNQLKPGSLKVESLTKSVNNEEKKECIPDSLVTTHSKSSGEKSTNSTKTEQVTHSKSKESNTNLVRTSNENPITHEGEGNINCNLKNINQIPIGVEISKNNNECLTIAENMLKNNKEILSKQKSFEESHQNHSNNVEHNSESTTNTSKNMKNLLNTSESPILSQKAELKMDSFFTLDDKSMSTPIKTYTAFQNFDGCNWFSTEELRTPNVVYHNADEAASLNANQPCPQTVCETIVTASTSFLSPIISLEPVIIAKKAIIGCPPFDASKDQTLHTPDVNFTTRSDFPNFKASAPLTNTQKIETVITQKNTELPSESLNAYTLQKPNENVHNLSSILNDISDYKNYSNPESIVLHEVSSASAIPAPVIVPEMEVDDSITFTGTGLSPFLIIQKPPNCKIETKNEDQGIVKNHLGKGPEEPVIETILKKNNDGELIKPATKTKLNIIERKTPKELREQRLKNNRLSLSTPKKPNNHIRALNFDTSAVHQFSSDSKINSKKGFCPSPDFVKRDLMKSKDFKSSMLQTLTDDLIITKQTPVDNTTQEIVRSSSENDSSCGKMEANKEKIEANQNEKNILSEQSSKEKNNNIKSETNSEVVSKKRSWDSDLRASLVEAMEYEPKKKKRKKEESRKKSQKKLKKTDKISSKKSKKINGSSSKESKDSLDKSKETEKKAKRSSRNGSNSDSSFKKSKHNKDSKKKRFSKELKEDDKLLTKVNLTNNSVSLNSEKIENCIKHFSPDVIDCGKHLVENTNKKSEFEKNPENVDLVSEKLNMADVTLPKNENKLNNFEDEQREKKIEKITIQPNNKDDLEKVKEQIEALLSNSAEEVDVIKLASEENDNLSKLGLSSGITKISKLDRERNEKSLMTEEALNAAFKDINDELSTKFFPKSQPENDDEKEEVFVMKSYDQKSIDYKKIEEQLSILTHETSITVNTSSQKTLGIYDEVSKVEPDGKVVQKKYARLKTLATKVDCVDANKKKRISPLHMPNSLDSPKKDENTLQVPPTPKIHSPSSCSFVMPISKHSEDSYVSLQHLVTTPSECPLTPQIVFTPPKIAEENPNQASQKCEGSAYYKSTTITFNTFKNPEITHFEVIKENLPKTEKSKSLDESEKISSSLAESMLYREDINRINSKSENSDSSSSSTCSRGLSHICGSSSSSQNDDVHSQNEENKQKKEIKNITKNDEHSPIKVFTINKTDKEIGDSSKETPAKDENQEIEIHDTPNVSKPLDNPTNLNARISQIMIQKEQEEIKEMQIKLKPKIISIERISPKITTKPSMQTVKTLSLNLQIPPLEGENELDKPSSIPKIKIEQSEEEVAKAVASIIATGTPEKIQENIQIGSNTPSPVVKLDDSNNRQELVKAIESITATNHDVQPFNESSNETDLKLVLEEDEESSIRNQPELNQLRVHDEINNSSITHGHNTRFQSRQKTKSEESSISLDSPVAPIVGDSNSQSHIGIYEYVFDEDECLVNGKRRKRRKAFTENELELRIQDDEDDPTFRVILDATQFEILYDMPPPRRKRGKRKEPIDSMDFDKNSAVNNEDVDHNAPKEPMSGSEILPTKRKRKRNSRYIL